MINLLLTNAGLVLHQKTTDMKNIVLICLLIAFTACSGSQIRSFCKNTGKKLASCCTSMTIQKKEALAAGMTADANEEKHSRYQAPAAISLLEWNEAVHVW
jgi:hypothetical protein